MKTMTKRIASVALTAIIALTVLVSALPAKAFAVGENATLTVQSSNAAFKDKTVKAWKMFDAKANADGSAATYALVDGWKPFFTDVIKLTNDDTLSQKAYEYVKKLDNSAKHNDFALKAVKWATGESAPVTVTSTSGAATGPVGDKYQAVFNNLDFGYYVMSPDVKGTNVERDAMLVNVIKTNVDTINLKSVFPTVDKTVGNESHASAQVGDELTFTLASTLPDPTDYTTYTFKFKDTLSKGLTFVDGSVKVQIQDETTAVDSSLYKVTHNAGSLVIELSDYKTNYQNYAGKKITVTYKALINENAAAVINQDNPNSATVEYTTDPTTGGTGESEESKVHTYTFGFDIDKVDGANVQTKLEGAVFELHTADGVKISLVKVQDGVFRPAKQREDAVADDQVKTDFNGKLQFVGLEQGTYQLVETVAPDGYNKLADSIKVIISATYNPDGTLNQWKADVENGSALNGTHVIKVENNKGALLPGTGGMGTVIFTVAGIAIIAGGIAWKRSRRAGNDA